MRNRMLWLFTTVLIGLGAAAVLVLIDRMTDLLTPWLDEIQRLVAAITGSR